MKFSRLEQFQAILVGLALADAAAQGRIIALAPLIGTQGQPDVRSPDWGKSLIQVAQHVTAGGGTLPASALDYPPWELAIVQVPLLLRHVDDSIEQYITAARTLGFPNPGESPGAELYQLLQVLLGPSSGQPLSMQLAALQSWLDRHPGPKNWGLHPALMQTLQAQGDFRLAIAGSLGRASSPLLPVLIGLFCTALRGLRTIPIQWRQELALPQPGTGYWQRWGVAHETELHTMATGLWRTWAGL